MFFFASWSNTSVALLDCVFVGVDAEVVWRAKKKKCARDSLFVPLCACERACVSSINNVNMHEL